MRVVGHQPAPGQRDQCDRAAGAKQALGRKFSVKDFHTALLRIGVLPLDILEHEVDRYIQSRM